MLFVLGALVLLIMSGSSALLTKPSPQNSGKIAAWGAVIACGLSLIPAVISLATGTILSLSLPWSVPFGTFHIEIDPLSAFFLLPLCILSALAAIYGQTYMEHLQGKKAIGAGWFFYNTLVASMILVVIARNAMLFLLAWEVMTLASFFLVTFEDEKPGVQRAGLTYLIATHLGTACLLVLFVLLGRGEGALDFYHFSAGGTVLPSVLLALALIGFGTKAGLVPFHVWLPEAHPAAPSHVSALMSAVMIKLGIYGILRVLTFLGTPLVWWGWLLIALGIASGTFGILFALAQRDLKRLLAYSSVENVGIVTIGIGMGLLGMSQDMPILAVLGWSGALLHILNHAFFKGLLFLGAGAVLHATGTRDMDRLGGLLKRMPSTGMSFLIGAAAICGLPPLNGFVSEFLIYLGAFQGLNGGRPLLVASVVVISSLAVIGALAVAVFTKAFGIVFLGEPRSLEATGASEAAPAMRIPMAALVAGCVAVGLFAPFVLGICKHILPSLTGLPQGLIEEHLARGAGLLLPVMGLAWGLVIAVGILWFLRYWLLRGRVITSSGTWDCGYVAPSPRMQYTGTSFAQPLTLFFNSILRSKRTDVRLTGAFPRDEVFKSDTTDIFLERFYGPAFGNFHRFLFGWRGFQHGRLQLYILYVIATLLALLIWKLW